ncbi:MAG TPA: hypothetical protein VL335_01475 [Candidatus Paceibacterota bacterium]|jgi:hypothetical protein|nr:hypothetical protein [Candidatus Paceibacterota bacterium]
MMFFNIPDIFNFGENLRQGYEAHYERKIGRDFRNSILLAPLEQSLANLQNIQERIGARIDKEVASGTDMTIPLASYSNADRILNFAVIAVGNATSTVTDTNPRPAYRESQAAYVALSQAREALNGVLNDITAAIEQASSTPHKTTYAKKRE